MPVGKRTTKVVCYNEQDDDDDFVTAVDTAKKNRSVKSNQNVTEPKSTTKPSARKSDEKSAKSKKEEPKPVPEESKKSPEKVPCESPIVINEKENTASQSSIASNESKTSSEHPIEVDDREEVSSPKNKRMKHEEDFMEHEVHEDESKDEHDETNSDEESMPQAEEKSKKIEVLTDHESSRIDTDHRKISTRISDLPQKKSSVPLGFPTSKINIPSPHMFRVGLSRKSATIKPLHPNIASRVVHD